MNLPRWWWLPFGRIPEISPAELNSWLEAGKPLQVVDARTALEYQQNHIEGARLAPVTGLPGSIDRLQLDQRQPVVVICLSGHRSRPGVRLLRRRGFQAFSLKGGMLAWWALKK